MITRGTIILAIAVALLLTGAVGFDRAQAWEEVFNILNRTEYASDWNGVYVVGTVGVGTTDIFLHNLWSWDDFRIWDSKNHYSDRGLAVTTASDGGVVAVGATTNPNKGDNWRILKYRANGTKHWTISYDDSGGDDVAMDVVADGLGSVYVAGYCTNVWGLSTFRLASYPDGNKKTEAPLWNWEVFPQNYRAADTPVFVAYSQGRVFIAGTGEANQDPDQRCWIIWEYDTSGNFVRNIYPWEIGPSSELVDFHVDSSGNIYAFGYAGDGAYVYKWGSPPYLLLLCRQSTGVDPVAISGEGDGPIFISGHLCGENCTVAYDGLTGEILWVNPQPGNGIPTDITICDQEGGTVVGYRANSGVKYTYAWDGSVAEPIQYYDFGSIVWPVVPVKLAGATFVVNTFSYNDACIGLGY